MVSKTARPSRSLPPHPWEVSELLLAIGYLGAICLGPLPPLAVFAASRRDPFARRHAVQALNAALTWLLYLVCAVIAGGVLAMVSLTVALAIMIPVTVAGWLVMAMLLVRAAAAAIRGGFRELPGWACATLVR